MKYLVVGAGYIGNAVADYLNCLIVDEKIHSQQSADDILSAYKPQYLINCIGKTGRPNIDWCENHKQETYFSNVMVPFFLNSACNNWHAKLIHVGSGCTYQGDNHGKGYSESDVPNWDGNYYAWTKIVSERYLQDFDVLQLRIRMPFNHDDNPRNLLTKILKYSKVVEEPNSITYIPDFLSTLTALIEKNATGIYNVVNRDGITHGRILHHFEKISNTKLNYELIQPQDLDQITKVRRSNCILSVEKLDKMGIYMPSSIDAMERCIYKYCCNKRYINE